MANTNENFKVRHGLEVGTTVDVVASSGNITTTGDIAADDIRANGNLTAAGNTVYSSSNKVFDFSGANATMTGNLTVGGDLTVNGTTTTLDTTNLVIEDNTILLNKNEAGAGVTAGTAGIEIERGSATNVQWQFNESQDWWEAAGGTGTDQQNIWAGGDIIAGELLASNGTSIALNNDDGAAADATITVKRGSGATSVIKWNNSTSRWQTSVDGSTYIDIPNQDLDTDGTPTFARLDVDNIRLDANTIVSTDTNGNITLDPNGTGNIELKTATAGNIWVGAVQTDTPSYGTSSNAAGNLVRGIVRDSTTRTNGDIWSFTNGTGTGARGFSVDNADNTAKAPMLVTRSFSGGAVNGNAVRGRHMVEKARGTASAPTAVQNGDFFGSFEATGFATDRWVTDANANVPAFMAFLATENWVNSGTTVSNCGMQYQVNLQPQATTLGTGSALPILQMRPEGVGIRGNTMVLGRGTGAAFTATGSTTSGTTLTIGTLVSGTIAVGQLLQGAGVAPGTYITANISGSGSGSTWTISVSQTVSSFTAQGFITYLTATAGTGNLELGQTPVLRTNVIKNSAALDSITLTSGNTITTTKADSLQFQNAAGTQIGSFADNGTQVELALTKTNATGTPVSSQVATINFTTTRASGNASQNTDKLGQYKFNGSTTSGVTAQPTCSINAYAAENFTLTAQGGRVAFQANKIGTISSIDLINIDSGNLTFQTDNIEFKDSSGTLLTRDKLDYTRSYGEFAYTNAAGFDIPAQNTIYTMPLDTTLSNSGNITISGTGTINLDIAGAYKIIMSLQVTLTVSNQPGQIDFWLRKNGADVANSKTQVDLLKDQKAVIAMDWLVESDGNDEFEIVYVGTTANYADIDFPTIAATTTPYVSPVAPALIVNVIPVGA